MKPVKRPLQYVSIPVNFIKGDEMADLENMNRGAQTVIFQILGEIAGVKAFYLKWDKKTIARIARLSFQTIEKVELICKLSLDWSIFDEKLFKRHKVLTSVEIQDNHERVLHRQRSLILESTEVDYILEDSKLRDFLDNPRCKILNDENVLPKNKKNGKNETSTINGVSSTISPEKSTIQKGNSNSNTSFSKINNKNPEIDFSEILKQNPIALSIRKRLQEEYSISEMDDSHIRYSQITEFAVFVAKHSSEIQNQIKAKFDAYFEYKEFNGGFRHEVANLLGNDTLSYSEAVFLVDNYSKKLQKEQKAGSKKTKTKQNGTKSYKKRSGDSNIDAATDFLSEDISF